ncbi:MAG: penicillin-binding transpeptidase domain-containing protein, partial [Actinomycetota bacterium]|nr:penicillin-binding transpeptidase domain-containing protein [Actinomycetota bacterium]
DSPAEVVFPGANAGEDYTVRNYDDASYGRQNLVEATRVSSNTVYAQLAEALGTAEVADMAERLGLGSEVPDDQLSVALGATEVSVLGMADAYLTFATRGVQVDPQVITQVTDAEGNVIDEIATERERVLEPDQADIVNFVLQGVVDGGTGTKADFDAEVAGKTGTTQDNGDAWFAGYTPGLSTAVWMGYPEGQARPMDSVHGVEVTGGSFPAEIFRKFMSKAVAADEETYGGDFVEPGDLGGRLLSGGRQAYVDPDAAPPPTEPAPRAITTTPPGPTTTPTTERPVTTTTPTTQAPASPRTSMPGITLPPRPDSGGDQQPSSSRDGRDDQRERESSAQEKPPG